MPDLECIHGLDLAACDVCSPKPPPVKPVPAARVRTPRATAEVRAKPVRTAPINRDAQRLHVVLSLDEFGDVLADGELVDPIYFHGPEELAWSERRRAADALRQVVLVTTRGAIAGLDTLPLSSVQLVAVANTVAQERVRELIAMTEFRARVVVHPPWFTADPE
jgi:hypothetical protein